MQIEVQQIETAGSVGFTGVYKPTGTPDPPPPNIIVCPPRADNMKPGGILPQANVLSELWLVWLGALVVSFVFILWQRKKKENI